MVYLLGIFFVNEISMLESTVSVSQSLWPKVFPHDSQSRSIRHDVKYSQYMNDQSMNQLALNVGFV